MRTIIDDYGIEYKAVGTKERVFIPKNEKIGNVILFNKLVIGYGEINDDFVKSSIVAMGYTLSDWI